MRGRSACDEAEDFGLLRFGGDDAAALLAGDVGVFEAVAGDGADDAAALREVGEGAGGYGILEALEEAGNAGGAGGFDEDTFV